jgi:uncharacterized protein (TIGR03435 family)
MRRIVDATLAGCLLGTLAVTQAPATRPAFEVASVKPAEPAERMSITRSGYRLTITNYSLQMLILWAFDIRNDRLFGKPKWLDSVRYDIVAQGPPEPPVVGRLQKMMQSLLADRFKLAVHHETRELPLYAMVVDRNGPKVALSETPDSVGQNPFGMPGRGHLTGTRVTAAMLANVLSGQLGRTVQDRTGLKGVFDFVLQWAPDTDATPADLGGPPAASAGPSIFTAIQEQLGFKLEPRKGPAEVLVIDHVDSTPAEN